MDTVMVDALTDKVKKDLPTAEEAFGPEPVRQPQKVELPTAEEAFGPEPTKPVVREREIMKTIPPLTPAQELAPVTQETLESPEFKKASTLTPEEEERAAKGRGTVYPLLGMMGGATVGHPVLGYAAGRQIADITNIAKGRPTEKSYLQEGAEALGAPIPQEGVMGKIAEQVTKVPEDIAVGKALELGGKLVGRGVGTVAKAVVPRIPVVGKIPSVRAAIEKLPSLRKSTPQKIEKLTEKVGGKLKPSLAGESAGEQLEIGSKEAKDMAEGLYNTAKAGTKDVQLIGEDYKVVDKVIDGIKGSGDYKLLEGAQKRDVNNAIRYAKEQTKRSIGLQRGRLTEEQAVDLEAQVEAQFGVPSPPDTSFEASEGLRRDLATKAYNEVKSPVGRLIKKLHNAVEDAQETAIKRQFGADSEAFQNWKNARTFYSENVFGEGKGGIIAKFQKMSPEKRVNVLRTGSLDDIGKLKQAVGDDGFQSLKQGYITDLIERQDNNPLKIAQELKSMVTKRGEQAELIFNKDELGLIKSIGDPGRVQKFLAEHPGARRITHVLERAGIYYGLYRGLGKMGLMGPEH